jgi:fructokinase
MKPGRTSLQDEAAADRTLWGALEAGGTKMVCLVGRGPTEITAEARFPTTTPPETLGRILDFFRPYAQAGTLAALGIGAFGPLDLDPASPTYGYITSTPKLGWRQIDLRGALATGLGLPTAIDTDVNAAALGEHRFLPQNRSLDPFVYMTIGTGIGAGAIVNGAPVHGLVHLEAGHVLIPHDWERDPFPGVCPFHGDCFEGLASGPALAARWGQAAETLPDDHPAWDLEADYIAAALLNLIYCLSPQRVVLGGGVMEHPGLLGRVQARLRARNRGYLQAAALEEAVTQFLIAPELGRRSGVLGALALAQQLAPEVHR